jgi:diguanylate cyclase
MSEIVVFVCPTCSETVRGPVDQPETICCPKCGYTWGHVPEEPGREALYRTIEELKSLERTIAELKGISKILGGCNAIDSLTGLPNAWTMNHLLECELRRRDGYPGTLAIVLIDVDNFKAINARYFLPGGDQVLRDLAKFLRAWVRASDHVGRIGGDEFMIIAPQINQGADALAERIRTTVANTKFAYKDNIIPVRVSARVTERGA